MTRYRIVEKNEPGRDPYYHIEKKGWFFWSRVTKVGSTLTNGYYYDLETVQDDYEKLIKYDRPTNTRVIRDTKPNIGPLGVRPTKGGYQPKSLPKRYYTLDDIAVSKMVVVVECYEWYTDKIGMKRGSVIEVVSKKPNGEILFKVYDTNGLLMSPPDHEVWGVTHDQAVTIIVRKR